MIRRMEFETLMEHVAMGHDATVLEIGSGDGFQLELLRRRFDRVFAVDPESHPRSTEKFCFAPAEALPFPDGIFDLVISSNVFEHLDNRALGLEEAVRVLKPGGYMAHVVPGRHWKVLSALLHPVGFPVLLIERWLELRTGHGRRREDLSSRARSERRSKAHRAILGWLNPPPHGTYSSHLEEFRMYGEDNWQKTFSHPKLVAMARVPTLSYSAYGLLRMRLVDLRKRLARHGFASTWAFILRRVA